MTGSMAWHGTWGWAGVRGVQAGTGPRAGRPGRSGRSPATGVLQGPWVPAASWGGRPVDQAAGDAAPWRRHRRARTRTAVSRRQTGQGLGWRRLFALAGDVLMVLIWAAMIPGMMWLGVAAGF